MRSPYGSSKLKLIQRNLFFQLCSFTNHPMILWRFQLRSSNSTIIYQYLWYLWRFFAEVQSMLSQQMKGCDSFQIETVGDLPLASSIALTNYNNQNNNTTLAADDLRSLIRIYFGFNYFSQSIDCTATRFGECSTTLLDKLWYLYSYIYDCVSSSTTTIIIFFIILCCCYIDATYYTI